MKCSDFDGVGVRLTETGMPELGPEAVGSLPESVRLIDVREPEEAVGELGKIDGSELVPLGTLATSARDWDRDAPLVVVCRSGARSARGVGVLQAMGFNCAVNMRGGMLAYRAGA